MFKSFNIINTPHAYTKYSLATTLLCVLSFLGSAQAVVQCTNENTSVTATTEHLQDNQDGTISDPKTGLIWKKCSEGQQWDSTNNACNGSAAFFTWQQALQHAQEDNTNWRLPNVKELNSIVESHCYTPAINLLTFPATASSGYWSSSPSTESANNAWMINFYYGGIYPSSKPNDFSIRLVRR